MGRTGLSASLPYATSSLRTNIPFRLWVCTKRRSDQFIVAALHLELMFYCRLTDLCLLSPYVSAWLLYVPTKRRMRQQLAAPLIQDPYEGLVTAVRVFGHGQFIFHSSTGRTLTSLPPIDRLIVDTVADRMLWRRWNCHCSMNDPLTPIQNSMVHTPGEVCKKNKNLYLFVFHLEHDLNCILFSTF